MRLSHAAAVWILDRLRLDTALAGDLLEECARGRSTVWYWRQVLIAVWVGTWTAIFSHKALALQAVGMGCVVNGIWLFLWSRFPHIVLPTTPEFSMESVASLSIILLTQTVTGWTIARTRRSHAIPMVFVFALWLVIWFLAGTSSEARRLLVNSIDQARFRPYLAWYFAPILIEVVGLFAGGLLAARPGKELHR